MIIAAIVVLSGWVLIGVAVEEWRGRDVAKVHREAERILKEANQK